MACHRRAESSPAAPKAKPKAKGIYWLISRFPELHHLDPVEKAKVLDGMPWWTYPLIIFRASVVAMIIGGIAASVAWSIASFPHESGPFLATFIFVAFVVWMKVYIVNLSRLRGVIRLEIAKAFRGQKPPFCFSCGYDLRGTTGSACPECGSAISTGNARASWSNPAPTSLPPPVSTPVVPPAVPQSSNEPRLSRMASRGATFAIGGVISFIAAFLFNLLVRRSQPTEAFYIVLGGLLLVGAALLLSAAINGAVALAEIKRSGGKLYGSRLAVAVALVLPLMLLIAVSWYVTSYVHMGPIREIVVGLEAVIFFCVARWAWRRMLGNAQVPGSASTSAKTPPV